jgi:hypothetical protein
MIDIEWFLQSEVPLLPLLGYSVNMYVKNKMNIKNLSNWSVDQPVANTHLSLILSRNYLVLACPQ